MIRYSLSKKLDRRHGGWLVLVGVFTGVIAGCTEEQVQTTTRNLERPGPMVLVCSKRLEGQAGATGLELSSCKPDKNDEGELEPPPGTLYGLVANTSRGDVALFRADGQGEPLIDLTPASPGFGFVPVGSLPSDIKATSDGCRVVTANAGSCDLSLIDVPGVLDVAARQRETAAGGVVARVVPRTASGPLLARPQELVIIPSSVPDKPDDARCAGPRGAGTTDSGTTDSGPTDSGVPSTKEGGAPSAAADGDASVKAPTVARYRAYVSFPSCNLIAEIDLSTGMVLRGALFTRQGVVFTNEPRCRAECAPRGGSIPADAGADLVPGVPAPPGDAQAGDARAGDAQAGDAGVPDAVATDAAVNLTDATLADATLADATLADATLADASLTDAGENSDSAADGANKTPVEAPPQPSVGSSGILPHSLALQEDGSRLYASSAGANFITVIEIDRDSGRLGDTVESCRWGSSECRRIVLAGELAQTTRIKLSPPTQAVGRFLYAIARDRSVRVISTQFELGVVEGECETNLDLAKVQDGGVPIAQARCFFVGAPGTPRRVLGGGTGLRFGTRVPTDVIFIQNEGEPADGGVGDAKPSVPLRGTHALIASSDGTVHVIDIEDGNLIPSDTATLFADHLPHRFRNVLQGTTEGVPDAGVKEIASQGSGGVPVIVSAVDGTDLPAEGVLQRAPGETVPAEWAMTYERRLVERYSGQIALSADGTELQLRDRGADFCAAGLKGHKLSAGRLLEHGDILVLSGCEDDDGCGLEQTCRKPVAQLTKFGLCLDNGRSQSLFKDCSFFLQQPRELLVREVRPDHLVLDVLPTEPQIVVPQTPAKDDCQANEDCADGFYCALADRKVEGRPELSVSAGQCFRPGCAKDDDCPAGRCVAPLDGSPKVCAPIPWPLDVSGERCTADEDCRPISTGKLCDNDRDCDGLAECALPRSDAGQRECVDRGMRCSQLTGLKGRCLRPSPCFAELLHYEVRAGRSFIIGSSHRQVADPSSGKCVVDQSRSPLFNNRVPVGPTVYPVFFGPRCTQEINWVGDVSQVPQPNPCVELADQSYRGLIERTPAGAEFAIEAGAPTTVVRFSNPYLSFSLGLSHLTTPPSLPSEELEQGQPSAELVAPPMPERDLNITLGVTSGFSRLAVPSVAATVALPATLVDGPDGLVYVVDQGDRQGTAGTKGQVIRFSRETLSISSSFRVK